MSKPDIGRKSLFLTQSLSEYCHNVWCEKNLNAGSAGWWKKWRCVYSFRRTQTNRQTDTARRVFSIFFFFQSVLGWSVAVSTICRHSSRVVSGLSPGSCEAKVQRANLQRSASIARSQMWLDLPAGRFQSGGTCRIHAARARWWSSRSRWTASNMAEEPQTSISHQVRERWTTSGSSDFRIWHMVSIRYPQDLA